MTTQKIERADLVEWVNHDHEHVSMLFDDLRATFNAMAQEDLSPSALEETLAQAFEDLDVALDDMLDHFSEEEEVYFIAIERRFPEYTAAIEELVVTHESICARVRDLQRQLGPNREQSGVALSARLIAMVNSLALEVERHNAKEQAVFEGALRQMSEGEQLALMHQRRALR